MAKIAKPVRDPFTLSLGGMTAVAGFTAAPAIADNRMNKIRDEQLTQVHDDPKQKPRFWRRSRHPVPQGDCA